MVMMILDCTCVGVWKIKPRRRVGGASRRTTKLMVLSRNNKPAQPMCSFMTENTAWHKAGKLYVLLHAVVCICVCFLGLEYLIGWRWIPVPIYVTVKLVAMVGFIPFVLSSPIISFYMAFVLSRRHREWLYLGICDAALFVLLIIGVVVASL